jgi:hypothetical protein
MKPMHISNTKVVIYNCKNSGGYMVVRVVFSGDFQRSK